MTSNAACWATRHLVMRAERCALRHLCTNALAREECGRSARYHARAPRRHTGPCVPRERIEHSGHRWPPTTALVPPRRPTRRNAAADSAFPRRAQRKTGSSSELPACVKSGVPTGIRTPVSTVKGWCPRPLDDGDAETVLRHSDDQAVTTIGQIVVEPGGIEPPTSCMPCRRSPS